VVKAHRFSKSAAEKIARAGGRAEVIAAGKPGGQAQEKGK